MLKAIYVHIFTLCAVAGIAMLIPVGFFLLPWLDPDTSDFVRIFGTVLAPFGTALWSIAIWKRQSRPWLAFFATAAVLILALKLGVYDLEVR